MAKTKKITVDDLLNLEGNKVPTDALSYSRLIYGPQKVGKAVDNETVIPTPDGFKKVHEIKENDYLFDREGNPTKVIGVYPQGKIEAYKVSLSDGTSFIVNGEHIIPYVASRGNINSKTLNEMMVDYTYTAKTRVGGVDREIKRHKYKIPKSNAVHYTEKELPLHPYALGVLIGDGSLTCEYLTVSSSEEDVINRFMKYAELKEFNKNKYNYNYLFQKQHNGDRPKEIQNIIENLGLNVKSIYRFIPREYLQGSIQQRKELLAGLMDTDGHVQINKTGSRRFGINTNSHQLAKDIKELVLSLGYGVNFRSYERKDNRYRNTEYIVDIYTKDNISKSNKHLQKLNNQADWYESKKELYSRIVNIEKVEDREMTCFSVDNEEELFLINDYIVTHNTSLVQDLYGERVLMLATEKRHAHIEGVHVINIDSYPEYLRVMRLLQAPELQEKYDALCIDTVGRMESYVEHYVLNKLNIEALGDLAYGAGYGAYNKELENMVSLIEKSGYVPVFISHDKTVTQQVEKTKATEDDKNAENASLSFDKKTGKEYIEYDRKEPDIKNKLNNLLARVVDDVLYLGFVVDENGIEERRIFTKPTANHFAGSSFNLPESMPQKAEVFKEETVKAIKNKGSNNLEEGSRKQSKGVEYNFDELMKETASLGKQLQENGKADTLKQVVEEVLGKGKKVKDLEPSQAEVLSALVDRLKEEV